MNLAFKPPAYWVFSAIKCTSLTAIPESSATIYRPPRDSTNAPIARIIAGDLSVWVLPMITDLPPPIGKLANAALYVMPLAKRNTSVIASSSVA